MKCFAFQDAVNKAMPPAPAPPVPPPVVEPLNTAFLGASSDTPIDVDSDSGTPPQSMIPLRPPPPPIPLRTDSSQGLAGSNNSSGSSSPFGMFPLGEIGWKRIGNRRRLLTSNISRRRNECS